MTTISDRERTDSIAQLKEEISRLRAECDILRAGEARMSSFAAVAADWFWETDANHRFVWLSERFEGVTGISAAVMLGRRQGELSSETRTTEPDLWQAHLADLAARRPFRDFRYWQDSSAGHPRWLGISGRPRFAPDGAFLGYCGTGVDMSSATVATDSALRMQMLARAVEQCPASIIITNLNGAIQYVNQKFIEVAGYSLSETLGQNPRMLSSGLTPARTYKEMWEALLAKGKWEGELVNRRRDGTLYWEYASIQSIHNRDGRVTNYLAIKSDVTEQKRNAARLATLVEELGRSNAELEQFAYVASHDLRQPLRMISAYLRLLQRRLDGLLDAETLTFLGFVLDSARRLDRMIVDLLQYSRIGRASVPLGPVDLAEVVRDCLRFLEVAIVESGAEVMVEGPFPVCRGDRTELLRLFQNLISNALTYVRPGEPPRVVVRCGEQGADWLLTVTDNGIGIREDDQERVFGIFQRLIPRNNVDGTGIGLAICRKIVEHHGGRIWVESRPGQGCRFNVVLPKAADPALALTLGRGEGSP